jgi:hypothetical protein
MISIRFFGGRTVDSAPSPDANGRVWGRVVVAPLTAAS